MRDTIPDGNPEPVADRQWGQDVLNEELKSDRLNPDKKLLGTEVGIADAMRFTGGQPGLPECCGWCSPQRSQLLPAQVTLPTHLVL